MVKGSGSRVGQVIAFVVIGTIVLLAGAGVYSAYQGGLLPIKPPPRNFNETVFPSFDNNADSQIIRIGFNTITVSQNELPGLMKDAIKPVVKGEYPQTSLLFPFISVNDKEIKEILTQGYGTDPVTGESDKHLTGGRKFLIPDKNIAIVVPVENAEVFRVMYNDSPNSSTNTPHLKLIVIRTKGSDNVKHEILMYSDIWYQILPLEILNSAPVTGSTNGVYFPLDEDLEKKGLSLPAGTAIAKINENNSQIKIVFLSRAADIGAVTTTSLEINSKFDFILIPDSNGSDKVAILFSK